MIFPYRERVYHNHGRDKITVHSPLIPIEVIGATGEIQYDALADTGSQITVFPSVNASKKYLTGKKDSIQAIDGNKLDVYEARGIWLKVILDGVAYK